MLSMYCRSVNINSPWIYQLSKFRMATACHNAMLASKFDLPFQLRRMQKKVLSGTIFFTSFMTNYLTGLPTVKRLNDKLF